MSSEKYKFAVSPKLLETLKLIAVEISQLNMQTFSKVVLVEMEQEADAQSSFSSTSIEGNPLPLTEVKKLLKHRPNQIRNTQREVLNYNEALIWLKSQIAQKKFEFDDRFVLEIHKRVMSGLLPKSQIGKYRIEPVFVNDPKLRKTIFWPPDHQDVQKLMSELSKFVKANSGKMDPIILAGIFHRQFVVIHPFVDGNGRTVRLVTKAILAHLGIDTFHLFSFENYYNRNVSSYFKSVGVRGNYYDLKNNIEFTAWIEYFAGGILDELLRVRKILESESRNVTPGQVPNEDQAKVLSYIKEHGFIRDRDYAKISGRAKATRALDFKKLIQLGLIEKMGKGPATYYKLKL